MMTLDEIAKSPTRYLQEYYEEMDSENIELLQFWSNIDVEGMSIVDIGCGPTIFTAIPLHKARSILLTDKYESNLLEVSRWINDDQDAFNWDTTVEFYLKRFVWKRPIERIELITFNNQLRRKLAVHTMDATDPDIPIYDGIVTAFCLECIMNGEPYTSIIQRLASKAANFLALVTVGDSDGYSLNGDLYQCRRIGFKDIEKAFKASNLDMVMLDEIPISQPRGYNTIYCAYGVKQ